ncbi:keratin-associated protein 10-4-like [Orussus abietinus]|uniref:keratin-associated protein 10-4-like n=1 Tax=Orussus abietinus TaxID=222816 RepID=UPI000626376B|nr:keratin-associated protein 10-4-like [Orussus abietinus]
MGPDCSCEGPDCPPSPPPCIGPDCTCEGDECSLPCIGPDCSCSEGDCSRPDPESCEGSDCSCEDGNCSPEIPPPIPEEPCVGIYCNLPLPNAPNCDLFGCNHTECNGSSCVDHPIPTSSEEDCIGDDCEDSSSSCSGSSCGRAIPDSPEDPDCSNSSCDNDNITPPKSSGSSECSSWDCDNCGSSGCDSSPDPDESNCSNSDCTPDDSEDSPSCSGSSCPDSSCSGSNCEPTVCIGDDCSPSEDSCSSGECDSSTDKSIIPTKSCENGTCDESLPTATPETCTGEGCSNEVPTTTEEIPMATFCDHQDPHHARKLKRLGKALNVVDAVPRGNLWEYLDRAKRNASIDGEPRKTHASVTARRLEILENDETGAKSEEKLEVKPTARKSKKSGRRSGDKKTASKVNTRKFDNSPEVIAQDHEAGKLSAHDFTIKRQVHLTGDALKETKAASRSAIHNQSNDQSFIMNGRKVSWYNGKQRSIHLAHHKRSKSPAEQSS